MNYTDRKTLQLGKLRHYEQQVNDRHATSSADNLEGFMRPENGATLPLAWRRVPCSEASLFVSSAYERQAVETELTREGALLIPVHPLHESDYAGESLVYSGTQSFSASYRTVFYKPDADGPFASWIGDDEVMMIKLHLAEPLAGIPGDRRLTRDKVEKCVLLSDLLPRMINKETPGKTVQIVPEVFGVVHKDIGAIFRILPAQGLMPVFSLTSRDRQNPGELPFLVNFLADKYGASASAAAESLGRELAEPLIRAVVAGFRSGFSLEMHAQNTLIRPGAERLIEDVYFRDLEGVVASDSLRIAMGMPAIFTDSDNPELVAQDFSMRRLFNRNVDHDLGRIFQSAIKVLAHCQYFDGAACQIARKSIRASVRREIGRSHLKSLDFPSRFMPISRAPWGSGVKPGHWFRVNFR